MFCRLAGFFALVGFLASWTLTEAVSVIPGSRIFRNSTDDDGCACSPLRKANHPKICLDVSPNPSDEMVTTATRSNENHDEHERNRYGQNHDTRSQRSANEGKRVAVKRP